ncbi:hypothetical protein [Microcoleus sp. FACHB-672]|uniref:hypothetical protein n=1 Tax=Microcoleus sp. FACHB-672 TaxID=2692825 RepID=UPI001683C5BA|nr:hypothetical protein [Microcoleus sp. FACHB-672]MBD2040230.1 hypothetical protein [Microcoleus sp. FACHB-672]
MAQSPFNLREAKATSSGHQADAKIWNSLKQAIAASSGFKRWQTELLQDKQYRDPGLDHQVRCYLRETLETLAY